MKTLNISIYPKPDKINSEGLAPLFASIGFQNNKSITFSLSEKVNYKRWQSTDQFRKSKDYEEKEFRFKVDGFIQKLYDIDEAFQAEKKAYTIEMVKARFLNKDTVTAQKTLNDAFAEFEKRFKEAVAKGNLEEKTFNKYNSMKHKLDEFTKNKPVLLARLDDKFNKEFHQFIQQSISLNVSNKYLISFRHIIKSAVEWGWIESFPFKDYPFSWEHKETTNLTEEEIQTIVKTDFSYNERVNRVKYLYLFMMVTGLAWRDLKELKKEDVKLKDGDFVIEKIRNKTKKHKARATIILTSDALEIIDRFKERMNNSEYLLPVMDNSDFNQQLKLIATECKIHKNLTCHVARHTAGVMGAKLGLSTREIAAMLGHKNERMSLHYSALAKTDLTKPMKKFEGLISIGKKSNLKRA